MLKLLNNCTHLICLQSSSKNSPSQVQQYVNHELADVQAGFRKGRGIRDQHLPTSLGSSKKQESSRNTSTFALLTMPKPLTV